MSSQRATNILFQADATTLPDLTEWEVCSEDCYRLPSADYFRDYNCNGPFNGLCEFTGADGDRKVGKTGPTNAVEKACDMGDAMMCENGGTCVQSIYNDAEYTCNCTGAFQGDHCEIPKCVMPVDTFGIFDALMLLPIILL